MSLLLGIPWEITRSILIGWVGSLKSLGKLDVAFSSSQREYYLTNLRGILHVDAFWTQNVSFYRWIKNRQVRLRYLYIGKGCIQYFESEGIAGFPWDSIEEILLPEKTPAPPVLMTIINKCTSLIRYDAEIGGVLEKVNSSVLANMKYIVYTNVTDNFEAEFAAIARGCATLQIYSVKEKYNDNFVYQDMHEMVIANNPALHCVEIQSRTTVINVIIKHCPLMKSIHLFGTDDECDLVLIAKAVKALPHLTYLTFGGRGLYGREGNYKTFILHCDCAEYMLSAIFSSIPDLVELKLPYAYINDELVQQFLSFSFHSVTYLSLHNICGLTVPAVQDLLRCPHLTKLELGGWSHGFSLGECFSVPNQVTSLNISANQCDLSNVIQILSHCEKLMHMEVMSDHVADKDDTLKDLLVVIRESGRNITFRACFNTVPYWMVFKNGKFE